MAANVPVPSAQPPRPGASAVPHMVLDPRHLGRPVHLLPTFTARWHDDFATLLRNSLNRRYGVAFEVTAVTLTRVDEPAGSGRWHSFLAAAGQIGFSIGRPLLLGILDLRYGARTPPPIAPAPPPEEDAAAIAELTGELTPEPEASSAAAAPVAALPLPPALARLTATEARLAESLGLQWVTALSACIDALAPARAGFAGIAPAHQFAAVITPPPGPASWTLEVTLKEATLPEPAQLWFTLSADWFARLLHNLTPAREKPREARTPAPPLAAILQITLLARLLRRETSLGQIVDLSVGDVIPIRLGPTEVLIDDTPLFTGAVVEQQGRLCLTAFKDID